MPERTYAPEEMARIVAANAAFQVGHERTKTDPHLDFCLGDAGAMADAAIDSVVVWLREGIEAAQDLTAMMEPSDFRRGRCAGYDDALALLDALASTRKEKDR